MIWQAVCKQQYQYQAYAARPDGSGVAVSPEYWVTFLWRHFMGRGVLKVVGGGGLVRVYAASGSASAGGAVVTAVIINLGENITKVPITIEGGSTAITKHELYTLTAWPDGRDMQSNGTALNGRALQLRPDGTAPAVAAPPAVAGTEVSAPPLSVSFGVFY